MHWIWANYRIADQEARISTAPDVISANQLEFDQGRFIAEVTFPAIVLIQDDDSQGVLTDNLVAPGLNGLAFSSRLRALLASLGVDNIQYFPLIVENAVTGARTEDYAVANLIGRVSCIDLAQSDVEMDPYEPDRIEFINALVLEEEKLADFDMCRTHEHAQVIVVHERVKIALESAGVTGIRFYAPADFTM